MMTGVEVGVNVGASSCVLLRSFPDLTLYMVDSWQAINHNYVRVSAKDQYDRMRKAERNTQFAAGRRILVRLPSVDAAAALPSEMDWVWIDADHRAIHVQADSNAWWPIVRRGGLLIWHDYDNPAPHTAGVKTAVDTFCRQRELTVNVMPGRVAWTQKV